VNYSHDGWNNIRGQIKRIVHKQVRLLIDFFAKAEEMLKTSQEYLAIADSR
jgi:hypothetical protein